jgi:hypothetical protein
VTGPSAPSWVHSVLPGEIHRQRSLGWPDFHPEDFCHRCGHRNIVWYANPDDWALATAELPRGVLEILCPSCFVTLREAAQPTGRGFGWHVTFVSPDEEDA